VLIGAAAAARGQSVVLGSVDVKENIVVDFQAQANGGAAVTPTCGSATSDRGVLCAGAARLEVKQGAGWVKARPHFEGAVLGGIGPDHKVFTRLDGSKGAALEFVFSKRFFGLPRGASLRIAVDVWQSEEDFRNGKVAATVRSEPFLCP